MEGKMDNQLTKQTKVDAINQHIYSINAQIYNLDLTLEEERSKEVIDQEMINQIESMRPDMIRKINKLNDLLALIN
jgi:cob(I)alamin adenosyltransferase